MSMSFRHYLPLLFKNYGLKNFCDLFEIKNTEFFFVYFIRNTLKF